VPINGIYEFNVRSASSDELPPGIDVAVRKEGSFHLMLYESQRKPPMRFSPQGEPRINAPSIHPHDLVALQVLAFPDVYVSGKAEVGKRYCKPEE
jgi:hypothetical protein